MNKLCTYWKSQIEALWESDVDFDELEALVEHMAVCRDCRSLWEARRWLEESSTELWQLSAAADAPAKDIGP